jgi:hypothetical protein
VRVGYADNSLRCTVSLYRGLSVASAVLFRGADVTALPEVLESREIEFERREGPDGGAALWLADPAGNPVILSGAGG